MLKQFQKLNFDVSSFSKSGKKIFNYINEHPKKVQTFTVHQLAIETNSSVGSILRFCQKIGYSGFKEFKFELNKELSQNERQVSQEDTYYLKQIIKAERILSTNDKNVNLLIKALTNKSNNILLGEYYSSVPVYYLYDGLIDLGYASSYATNINDGEHLLNTATQDSTIVLFTIHGLFQKYKNYWRTLIDDKRNNSFLITMNKQTSLQNHFAHTIFLPGNSIANQFVMDPQSIPVLFTEILLNKISSIGIKK